MKVIQNLIIHDAIGKRKIVLDQLREGLQTLGFLGRMSVLPDVFKSLFVSGNNIQPDTVIDIFTFPNGMSNEESTIAGYLQSYIRSSSNDRLQDLLIFLTGAPCLPDFGLGKIKVDFYDDTSIFSSTCLKKVQFPRNFEGEESFSVALNAVCQSSGKAFTSVWNVYWQMSEAKLMTCFPGTFILSNFKHNKRICLDFLLSNAALATVVTRKHFLLIFDIILIYFHTANDWPLENRWGFIYSNVC